MIQHAMKRRISAMSSSTLRNERKEAEHGIHNHAAHTLAYCGCPPLSTLYATSSTGEHKPSTTYEQIVPATPELNSSLRSQLQALFPPSTSLSVIVLHVTQVEHLTLLSCSDSQQQRYLHHGPSSFIEQILVNLRRVIRSSDRLLLHEGAGFALVLPDVDQQGTYLMLERIYHSINLLQAETVTPPLTRETNVLLGSGSYPEQGSSIEQLLYACGFVARSLTLRPALPVDERPLSVEAKAQHTPDAIPAPLSSGFSTAPFMKLPRELPPRLKRLIPGALAREIRSVPVGRDHQRLTVAMADPTNNEHIHRLQMTTALTIFPVSCHEDELDLLLEKLN